VNSGGGEGPSKADLQKQYELVLQEYRFQIQLNWDRAKHFLVFNTAIVAAAVALYKTGTTPIAKLGVAALMLLAVANSLVGRNAVGQGHEIYRRIRSLKSKLERLLNLGDLAIQSTAGMKREHDVAPEGTPETGSSRLTSITSQVRGLLLLICLFSGAGAIYAVYDAIWGARTASKDPTTSAVNRANSPAAGYPALGFPRASQTPREEHVTS
jgi:hypothetical protein